MPAFGRLPGLQIDVAPPPAAEVLPRMDIAVLVGFAARGPTHRPVAVESVRQFEAVFGPDAPLAWDAARGERAFANLPAAVRLFFANGGRRAWVIRVARTRALEALWRRVPEAAVPGADLAVANRFPVPGMLSVADGADGTVGPAFAHARSLGSWSDGLRLSAALQAMRFPLRIEAGASPPSPALSLVTGVRLQTGDLIELGAERGAGVVPRRLFARIETVAPETAGPWFRVAARLCAGFESWDGPDASPGASPGVVLAGEVAIDGVLPAALPAELSSGPGSRLRLVFEAPSTDGIGAGLWARWEDASRVAWVQIEAAETTMPTGAPAAGPPEVRLALTGRGWRQVPALLPTGAPEDLPGWADLLTVDLAVHMPLDAGEVRLNGVGLTSAHPAGWWRQASDELPPAAADARDGGGNGWAWNGWSANGWSGDGSPAPGFPLAAGDEELVSLADRGSALAWIPLAVPPLFGPPLFGPPAVPLPLPGTALERDGLSRLDAELFLDPALADLGLETVLAHGDAIRFLADRPRSLFGLHAALSIGYAGGLHHEASLIALPDAVHIGWRRRPAADVPSVPVTPVPPPAHWFTHRGPCAAVPANAAASGPDFSRFLDCGTRALPAPRLDGPDGAVGHGLVQLSWTPSAEGAVHILEEARSPDFGFAREVWRGVGAAFNANLVQDGIVYYRVRTIVDGAQSPPSNTVAVVVRADAWEMLEPADFGSDGEVRLLAIQRAALRMAAATGELFAVLSLPHHYRAADAIAHAARLRARHASAGVGGDAFGFDERRALSYGALYHPWVIAGAVAGRDAAVPDDRATIRRGLRLAPAADQRRLCPPDGAVLGVMAARAHERGAWIAPANAPLTDVVALAPAPADEALLPLHEGRVNALRSDPRGFLCLSAETLADELEWRPINVRRLMLLLRRLALRRGSTFVFEPNDDVLARSVERGFETLLGDLLRRGAFAGPDAARSYRVTAGTSPADRDGGRLLVELRVAPALPLQFLTLRLRQRGERQSVVEEA